MFRIARRVNPAKPPSTYRHTVCSRGRDFVARAAVDCFLQRAGSYARADLARRRVLFKSVVCDGTFVRPRRRSSERSGGSASVGRAGSPLSSRRWRCADAGVRLRGRRGAGGARGGRAVAAAGGAAGHAHVQRRAGVGRRALLAVRAPRAAAGAAAAPRRRLRLLLRRAAAPSRLDRRRRHFRLRDLLALLHLGARLRGSESKWCYSTFGCWKLSLL